MSLSNRHINKTPSSHAIQLPVNSFVTHSTSCAGASWNVTIHDCLLCIKQKIPVLCIVMKQITYINKLFTKTFIIKSVSCMAEKNFRSSGSLGHKRLLPPHLTERSLLHLTLPLTHSLPHPHYTSFPHPEQF